MESVTFRADTTAGHFANWLEKETRATGRRQFQTEAGNIIGLQPAIFENFDRLIIPGFAQMKSATYDLGGLIAFDLTPLSGDRVHITATCYQEITVGYFLELLIGIMENWPGTAREIARYHRIAEHVPAGEVASEGTPGPKDSGEPQPRYIWRRSGEVWEIAFGDDGPFHLPDLAGCSYIACLLRNRNKSLHLNQFLILSAGGIGSDRKTDAYGDLSTTPSRGQPMIGRDDKAELEAHLKDLCEEREEMRELGHVPEHLDLEIAKTVEYLRNAQGLGGRPRSLAPEDESRRISTKKAIDLTISKIEDHSPALAHHLQDSISTGWNFSYNPAEPVPWEL